MASTSLAAAYLEFARNLTPQIVFGTCFMLLSLRIDIWKLQLDWEGLKNAAAFWSCAFLFFGTMLANISRGLQLIAKTNDSLDIELMRIRSKNLPIRSASLEVLRAAWRLNRWGILQSALVFVVSYAGVFVVVEMAAYGALAALKNGTIG